LNIFLEKGAWSESREPDIFKITWRRYALSRSPSSSLDRLSGMLTMPEKSEVEAEARCHEAEAKDVA